MNILNKIFISVDITNVEGVQDCKKWSPNGHHILNKLKKKNRAELVNTVLGIKDFQSVLDVISIHIISHLNVLCTQILQKDVNIYEIT